MILKILEKLGRKKIVLDRGPTHPEYQSAKPWMERYYLLFRKRPKGVHWLIAIQVYAFASYWFVLEEKALKYLFMLKNFDGFDQF